MADTPPKVRFEFIKSPLFRVIHADGVFGGMTPRGQLLITFFNERVPIPTAIVHGVQSDGELGDEVRSEREGRKGILREVDVGVHLELDTAKSVVKWLHEKIEEIEKHRATLKAKEELS